MNWFIEHWQETFLGLFSGVAIVILGWFFKKKRDANSQSVGKKIKAEDEIEIEDVKQKSSGNSDSKQTVGEDMKGKKVVIKNVDQDSNT
jgi:hypothetical protein